MIPRYSDAPSEERKTPLISALRMFLLLGVWVLVGIAAFLVLGELLS